MGSGSVVSSGGSNTLTTSGTVSLSSANMNVAYISGGTTSATSMTFADTLTNQGTTSLFSANTFNGAVTNESGATMILRSQSGEPTACRCRCRVPSMPA